MDASFQIQLNGDVYGVAGDSRLTTLIERLRLRPGRVAVEINQVVVPKARWAETRLKAGDVVEVVNFVGGG